MFPPVTLQDHRCNTAPATKSGKSRSRNTDPPTPKNHLLSRAIPSTFLNCACTLVSKCVHWKFLNYRFFWSAIWIAAMNLAFFDGIHADDGLLGGAPHIGMSFPGRVLVSPVALCKCLLLCYSPNGKCLIGLILSFVFLCFKIWFSRLCFIWSQARKCGADLSFSFFRWARLIVQIGQQETRVQFSLWICCLTMSESCHLSTAMNGFLRTPIS